ncbi:MAG: hypothetical protein ABI836_07505 [Gemmatimonadota bacterium]
MPLFRVLAMVSGFVLGTSISCLQAQALTPGTWTGSATKDNGDISTLTFDVAVTGDSIAITINSPERDNSFAVLDVKLANNTLSFSLPFGPDSKCVLARQTDGAFFGSCSGGAGAKSDIQMFPPARE